MEDTLPIKSFKDLEVGDFLEVEEEYATLLYEITRMGSKHTSWHLKARCFFSTRSSDIGKKITLYKLNKEDE